MNRYRPPLNFSASFTQKLGGNKRIGIDFKATRIAGVTKFKAGVSFKSKNTKFNISFGH